MRRESRPWEVLLQAGALLAALVAVFQQDNGLGAGAGLIAVLLFALIITLWVRRRSRFARRRLNRSERAVLDRYFREVVDQILRELPLPDPARSVSLPEAIRSKSAYVPVPYRAYATSPGQITSRPIGRLMSDPVAMITAALRNGSSCLVVGEPGTGKTLLSALVFAELAEEFMRSRREVRIPIFIRLNSLDTGSSTAQSADDVDVVGLLPRALLDLGEDRLRGLVRLKRFYFVLDGLDEMPSARAPRRSAVPMPAELLALVAHDCVVTCREAFHSLYVDADKVADGFDRRVQLLPFTYEDQVVPFVETYCRTLGKIAFASKILEAFGSNSKISETLSRPLMLRMTVEVLCDELDRDPGASHRVRLTGSDYLSAEIYDRYVLTWLNREHRKAGVPWFGPLEKIQVIERVAWHIFSGAVRADATYGAFELSDLLIDRTELQAVVNAWIAQRGEVAGQMSTPATLVEIEERTFLIVSDRGDSFRFAHKSFFEYLLARHIFDTLSARTDRTDALVELLQWPLPDEVIDFLRELLHWANTEFIEVYRRRNAEASLMQVLRWPDKSDRTLMSRQQAANLLPIIASAETREALRASVVPSEHPFIRRAIAVGEALHHSDHALLDQFVLTFDTDADARDFHMGYNRIYYGDQPLGSETYRDDDGPECFRFFRACLRHMQLERYRYIRTMAIASVRLMLLHPGRRSLLLDRERESFGRIRDICARPESDLGPVHDKECRSLLELLDQLLPAQQHAAPAESANLEGAGQADEFGDLSSDVGNADDKDRGYPTQPQPSEIETHDGRASLLENEQSG